MFKYRSLFVAGLSLMPLAMLPAQETRRQERQERRDERRDQPTTRTDVRVSGEARSSSQLDRYFVSCLKTDNKGEVTIATLGSQKASNPDVKAFAQEMVKDHTDFLAKLERFEQSAGASKASAATTRTETRESTSTNKQVSSPKDAPRDQPRDNTKPREGAREAADNAANPPRADVQVNRTETTRTDANRTSIDGRSDIAEQLMLIKQEIGEKCVASAQKELSAKEGAEFDRCFVGMQIGGHMHMVDSLTILTNHASPELKQILDEGLQTSQQHLEHAKQLAKKLEGSSANAGERTNERATTRKEDRRNPEKDK